MIEFQASTPYPVVTVADLDLSEMRRHSAAVDRWLGFDLVSIETELALEGSKRKASVSSGEKQELWFGLETQLLLTPYLEIRALLEWLQPRPGQTFVDLGAAYGRMAFVLARHYPQVRFIGYEYVGERVEEAQRVMSLQGLNPKAMEHRDLTAAGFAPAAADLYFLYDFGTEKAIEKSLYDLQKIARDREIVIVGRGRHCRALIAKRHSWLVPTISMERITIYRAQVGRELAL